jgi:hypothetical protein
VPNLSQSFELRASNLLIAFTALAGSKTSLMDVTAVGISQESASHALTAAAADVLVLDAISALDDIAVGKELIALKQLGATRTSEMFFVVVVTECDQVLALNGLLTVATRHTALTAARTSEGLAVDGLCSVDVV